SARTAIAPPASATPFARETRSPRAASTASASTRTAANRLRAKRFLLLWPPPPSPLPGSALNGSPHCQGRQGYGPCLRLETPCDPQEQARRERRPAWGRAASDRARRARPGFMSRREAPAGRRRPRIWVSPPVRGV